MTYGDGKAELNNLEFSPEFFYDEVREGFFVTTMMKRYWASQLKVLSIIARICDKYGLKWYADYGTLLGAVRHGGYVPWDDDLDICMLRDDWEKFFEVAQKEVPAGYKLLTIKGEIEYNEVIGRVCNTDVIDYGKEHLDEFYGCPYTTGIDIFPLDGIYNDPEKEKDRNRRAKKALNELNEYTNSGNRTDPAKLKKLVKKVESIYSECPVGEAENLALMPFFITENNHIFPKRLFEHTIKLPFENTFINVSARYDEMLSIEYGDYLRVFKGGGIHDYPVFCSQEKILKDKLGKNPFRYSLNMNELLGSVSRYVTRTMKQMQGENYAPKKKKVVFLPCKADWWDSMEPLWKKYSEDKSMEVHVLPVFYYDSDHSGGIGKKHDERDLFPDYLNVEACEKYDFEGNHPDIIVIQVPYDGYSTAMTVHEFFYSSNLLRFTDELIYIPCFDIDPPEDENDKSATAISVFIEQEGVVNADRVVLKSEDMRTFYINKLVELSSEDTRQYWEQKIVVLESDDNKEGDNKECDNIEKTEVVIKDKKAEDYDKRRLAGAEDENAGVRKLIIYYVGISSLLKYGEDALEKIEGSFDIFEDAAGKIDVVFVPGEQILESLKDIDPKLWVKFEELTNRIAARKNIVYDPEQKALLTMDNWSAYYGDAGPYVRKCVLKKIPVMIQNYEIRKN